MPEQTTPAATTAADKAAAKKAAADKAAAKAAAAEQAAADKAAAKAVVQHAVNQGFDGKNRIVTHTSNVNIDIVEKAATGQRREFTAEAKAKAAPYYKYLVNSTQGHEPTDDDLNRFA